MGLTKDLLQKYPTLEDAYRLCEALEVQLPWEMSPEYYFRIQDKDDPMTVEECQEFFRGLILDCAEREILRRREKLNISKLVTQGVSDEDKKWFFVTVGFNDSIVTDENEVTVFNSVIGKLLKTPNLNNIKFSAEKFRENGIHRHLHLLLESDLPKSKVIQFCFQKVKAYVHGQQAVDVKTYKDNKREVYEKYIRGDKRIEKMKFVEMDREWRKEKNIREDN